MILTHWLAFELLTGGSPSDAPVVEPATTPYPPPAGKSRRKDKRRRRYELPNGLHIHATPEEAQAAAEEMLGEARAQLDPPRPARKVAAKLAVAPMREVVLDDGFVLRRPSAPAVDKLVAFSRQAEADAIAYENLMHLWRQRRRRRKAALLLGS